MGGDVRAGALAANSLDELRTLVSVALPVVWNGLDRLPEIHRRKIDAVIVAGGRLELRIGLGFDAPTVSLFLCDHDGPEIELGFSVFAW